mgnify:CR=1 FL=1
MTIDDLASKHGFTKDVDYWQHKQSGQWILKHDSVEKIANAEDIRIQKIESLYQSETSCRFLITMGKWVHGACEEVIITTGEADKSNCTNAYLVAMAEKRGKDRAILKLIKAYEYGISSEEEADDFKQSKPKASKPKQQKDKPKTIPPVNLKDQEVPNPHYDKVVNELGGIPLGDGESDDDGWSGNEIIKFGKYRDVAWKDCLDESYINWVATSSKVDWQRELALKELKRRSK